MIKKSPLTAVTSHFLHENFSASKRLLLLSVLSQDTPNITPTADISLIRRLKMDRVVSFLLWPFQFLANSGKWLARQMRPIRDEEKADDENEKTDDSCCFLGIFGAGVSVGSLYYIPTQYNAV